MNHRSLLAAPIAIMLAVLSLAAVRSNTEITRPIPAAPLALRPGLSITTLPVQHVHPSPADRRAAALLLSQSEPGDQRIDETTASAQLLKQAPILATAFRPAMPYYAFAPRLLNVAKD